MFGSATKDFMMYNPSTLNKKKWCVEEVSLLIQAFVQEEKSIQIDNLKPETMAHFNIIKISYFFLKIIRVDLMLLMHNTV